MTPEVETLITQYIPLVKKMAGKYVKNRKLLEYDDLFQVGCRALTEAAMRFDASKGYSFATYAVPWIEGQIITAINEEDNLIRIPQSAIRQACGYLNAQNNNESTEQYEKYKYLRSALRALATPISFDAPVAEDMDDINLCDIVLPVTDTPESLYLQTQMPLIIGVLLSDAKLTDREKMVFVSRLGLYTDKQTDREIAEKDGSTRSNISQLYQKALKKVRTQYFKNPDKYAIE